MEGLVEHAGDLCQHGCNLRGQRAWVEEGRGRGRGLGRGFGRGCSGRGSILLVGLLRGPGGRAEVGVVFGSV